MSACKSCGAPIEWADTAAGKHIPLDAVSVQRGFWDKPAAPATEGLRGKLVLIAGVVRPATDEDVRLGRELRISHFATCPNAAQHRRGIHG